MKWPSSCYSAFGIEKIHFCRNIFLFEFLVQFIKKKWKSLRDNFRTELKKVPFGKSGDIGLPVDQYLSRWPYFRMMFFLRDSMLWKKVPNSLVSSNEVQHVGQEPSSPTPTTESGEVNEPQLESNQNQELQTMNNEMDVEKLTPSFQLASYEKPSRKRKSNLNVDNDSYIHLELENREVEKHRRQILLEENRRRKKEEDDADRHFLLSLLPSLAKVPEHKKLAIRIRIYEVLKEALLQEKEDCAELRQVPS